MNSKTLNLIQHKLIPIALIAGNIALVHAIYLLAETGNYYTLFTVVICLVVLAIGILRSAKYMLLTGIVFYTLILLFVLMASDPLWLS